MRVLRAGTLGKKIGWAIVAVWGAFALYLGVITLSDAVRELRTKGHGPESGLGLFVAIMLLFDYVVILVTTGIVPLAAYCTLILKTTRPRCDACGW